MLSDNFTCEKVVLISQNKTPPLRPVKTTLITPVKIKDMQLYDQDGLIKVTKVKFKFDTLVFL